jgi:serine/threonine protein kinase
MDPKDTICPSCEATGGEIGQPCHQKVCGKKGYHYIPRPSYENYLRWLKANSATEDPEIGRYIDRFLVVEKIGQGGMGAVYLALQTPLMREVALKVVSGLVLDDNARQRFEREAKAISILYHPNIVSLVDYGFNKTTGAPFMALEYIREGVELSDEIYRRREKGIHWTRDEVIDIFTQILNGLSVAHKSGLVHRDIKPQNIMLVNIEGNEHFVKILDFGLSKALGKIPDTSDLTAKGLIMGTPKYMSPEQLRGSRDVDSRSDLYSVGTFLFEMVTGLPLFAGKDTGEILVKKLRSDYSPLKNLPENCLPPDLDALMRKALAADPRDRFESASEMKEVLVETISKMDDFPGVCMDPLPYAPTMEFKPAGEKTSDSTTYEILHDFVDVTGREEKKEEEDGEKAPGTLPPLRPGLTGPPSRKRTVAAAAGLGAGGVVLLGLLFFLLVYPLLKRDEGDRHGGGEKPAVAADADAGPESGMVDQASEENEPAGEEEGLPEPDGNETETEGVMGLDFDKIADNLEELETYKKSMYVPPEKLINNVMYSDKLWPKLNHCVGKKKGTAVVRVHVSGKTGRVTSASIISGKFKGTKQGTCILQAIRKNVKFPTFKKNEIQVTRKYPFK